MQHLRTGRAGARRQQNLIPQQAPIETPRIELGLAQLDDAGAGRTQRFGQSRHVLANARSGSERQLRVERNDHFSKACSVCKKCERGSYDRLKRSYCCADARSPSRNAATPNPA